MGAGSLRHRITLQRMVRTPDGMGGGSDSWVDVDTLWAEVQPLTGKAYMAAKQAQSDVSHRVRIRFREGITPDMRIQFGTRIFQIDAVLCPNERRQDLHLMCVERSIDA
ncbi:head-tail adaptor protein [Desulfovibrio desulfuricans]|uniref:phage head closure protein n=1 Tax=Nitratidesulfovibrio vulgaris TaxID=881 RepID=UPI0011429E21|nr:phage head closure protein [Nitratidesulfovibrio vulgaris]WCB45042.1 phage head closure protein [Nitratidesulfovibrio vulgaris]GEB79225.1 head-tail adaptor protein [Desulfovibrio desulfuricans]